MICWKPLTRPRIGIVVLDHCQERTAYFAVRTWGIGPAGLTKHPPAPINSRIIDGCGWSRPRIVGADGVTWFFAPLVIAGSTTAVQIIVPIPVSEITSEPLHFGQCRVFVDFSISLSCMFPSRAPRGGYWLLNDLPEASRPFQAHCPASLITQLCVETSNVSRPSPHRHGPRCQFLSIVLVAPCRTVLRSLPFASLPYSRLPDGHWRFLRLLDFTVSEGSSHATCLAIQRLL